MPLEIDKGKKIMFEFLKSVSTEDMRMIMQYHSKYL